MFCKVAKRETPKHLSYLEMLKIYYFLNKNVNKFSNIICVAIILILVREDQKQ